MAKLPMKAVLSLGSLLMRAHALEQPFRTLLTVAGVGLGVLASVAVTAANVEALRAFERAVLTVAGAATLEVSGHDQGLDETILPVIRNVPGVVEVAPIIEEALVRIRERAFRPTVWICSTRLAAEDFISSGNRRATLSMICWPRIVCM